MKSGDVCLCLNFDINKTIIMSDAGTGLLVEQTLNSLLSECVWGIFDRSIPLEQRIASDWKILSPEPNCEAPMEESVSFGTYLEDHTLIPKDQRRKYKTNFTAKSSIGEGAKPSLQVLYDSLRIPDCRPSKAFPGEQKFCADGFWRIIPAFFRMIEYLITSKIDFRIIFRTFGVDIASVGQEYNMFCEDRHPGFPVTVKLDGTDPLQPIDYRLKMPSKTGSLFRTGHNFDDINFAYVSNEQAVEVERGLKNVRNVTDSWLGLREFEGCSSHKCIALRDDFTWWSNNGESDSSGKLLLVDSDHTVNQQLGRKRIIEVFFDDNIERDKAHIVDVRDSKTFEPLPFETVNKIYLRRVEPFLAIIDPDYYIKQIEDILLNHKNQIITIG